MTALSAFTDLLDGARHFAGNEALTLVYRILFLLFAESRDLVPRHHPAYRETYTLSPLCDEALRSSRARGLWDGLAAICRLSRQGGARGHARGLSFQRPPLRHTRGAVAGIEASRRPPHPRQ